MYWPVFGVGACAEKGSALVWDEARIAGCGLRYRSAVGVFSSNLDPTSQTTCAFYFRGLRDDSFSVFYDRRVGRSLKLAPSEERESERKRE